MFVINILIPALSLIISTLAIIIGVYNHMFSQGVMRDMKKHLMYKIPYKERKEYLDFIFTFSLFLEFEDMNFLSVKKNDTEDIECYLHAETNNVDKIRKVAIEYNVKEIPCDESLIEYIKLARCKGKNVIGTTIPYLVSREEIKKILDTI